jgi:hyaluronoglucosaminidase
VAQPVPRRRITLASIAALLALSLLGAAGPAASSPEPLALYVTDLAGGTLVPVDGAARTAGPPIPVGNVPVDVAITPDGATAYVVLQFSSAVVPVDLATSTIGTAIPVECPAGIALVEARQGPTSHSPAPRP